MAENDKDSKKSGSQDKSLKHSEGTKTGGRDRDTAWGQRKAASSKDNTNDK